MALLMLGCEKSPEKLIVGTWKVTEMEMMGQKSPVPAGMVMVFDFQKYGNFTISTPGGSAGGTYTISDKTLTMSFEGDIRTAEIKSITKKELALYMAIDDVMNGTFYFERQ